MRMTSPGVHVLGVLMATADLEPTHRHMTDMVVRVVNPTN